MGKTFDIGIESLAGGKAVGTVAAVRKPRTAPLPLPLRGAPKTALRSMSGAGVAVEASGKSFFIETFGCQMNDHDSEKVAGVLLGRGYRQVEKPDDAGVVLYNTCSIREKAASKVFSRLGLYKDKAVQEGKIIGVLGCVAQQEGEVIFDRAPWVSLVCGSASYRQLPDMITRLEAGERRVTGLDKDVDET